MKNWYLKEIEEAIENQVASQDSPSVTETDFINSLFSLVVNQIRGVEKIKNKPPLDDKTLADYIEIARKLYLSREPTLQSAGVTLTSAGEETWLTNDRIAATQWHYSDRYFRYLEQSGRPRDVLESLRLSSRKILSELGDPQLSTSFFVKGLVVGEVQSGKTGNFNAVINRAIDSGYRLIVVLSGVYEDLRGQTQLRIEEDVVGWGTLDPDTDRQGQKGVSREGVFGYGGFDSIEQVVSITSYKSDFSKTTYEGSNPLNFCNIMVCKKNVKILEHLLNWLYVSLAQGQQQHDLPLLILDDEADNASLNNLGKRGIEYASKVNGHIRALLNLFSKKSYLGYTATPFANVLQDRNTASEDPWLVPYEENGERRERAFGQEGNLFPDDFIHLLDSPSNYIGAKQIFETINQDWEKLPLVNLISDNIQHFPTRVYVDPVSGPRGVVHIRSRDDWDEKIGRFNAYDQFEDWNDYRRQTVAAKADHDFPYMLPESLFEALLCFILGIAVRESRDRDMRGTNLYQPHNTMLIHVSRFVRWQNKTKILVDEALEQIIERLSGDPAEPGSIYSDLERVWLKRCEDIVGGISSMLPRNYSDPFMRPVTFSAIRDSIPMFIRDIEVKALNNVTKEKLKYKRDNPRKVIVIGGNRLSRGFTLEGLTVSYFVRTTNYSDSLFQMGRWFGYRPGYLDCCKIFTTSDALDGFNKTTRLVEELEVELMEMANLREKPSSYELRVRRYAGVLEITRPSLMRKTESVVSSFQDSLQQTTKFDVSKEKIASVWEAFKSNVAPLFQTPVSARGFLEHDIDAAGLIQILNLDNNFESGKKAQMIAFIKACDEIGKLRNWKIAIKTTGQSNATKGKGFLGSGESSLPCDIRLAVRRGPSEKRPTEREQFLNEAVFWATGPSAQITSPKDLAITLEEQHITDAEASFREYKKRELMHKDSSLTESEAEGLAAGKTVPGKYYIREMEESTGVLLVYLFDSYYSFNQERGSEDEDFGRMVAEKGHDLNIPIVGYALGFPPIDPDPGGAYVHGGYDLNVNAAEDDEEAAEIDDLPEDAEES